MQRISQRSTTPRRQSINLLSRFTVDGRGRRQMLDHDGT